VLEQFMTDTADLADYVLPATTQLEHLDLQVSYGHTYALGERAGDRATRRSEAEHRDLPPAGGADGLRRFLLRRERRGPGAHRLQAGGRGRLRLLPSARPRLEKLPIAEAPFAEGGFATPGGKCRIDAPGSACPTTSRTTNRRSARPSSRPAFRWR
jgi:hypothetical protein